MDNKIESQTLLSGKLFKFETQSPKKQKVKFIPFHVTGKMTNKIFVDIMLVNIHSYVPSYQSASKNGSPSPYLCSHLYTTFHEKYNIKHFLPLRFSFNDLSNIEDLLSELNDSVK